MLFEGAVGDAFGIGFEYADEIFVRHHMFSNHYVKNPKNDLTPGIYSDNTRTSVALVELLCDKVNWTTNNITNKLAEVNVKSDKGGPAVRAACLGYLPDDKIVSDYAEIQARVTHNSVDEIKAAQISALLSFFLHKTTEPMRLLGIFLNSRIPVQGHDWRNNWSNPVGSNPLDVVHAAITVCRTQKTLMDVLRASVSFTGNVASVASISMQASCSLMTDNLFVDLINNLDRKDYIIALDQRFVQEI